MSATVGGIWPKDLTADLLPRRRKSADVTKKNREIPHWRFAPESGINLKRVFLEPREFDLVLWAHGAAAVPYAEKGPVTSAETWRRLERLFGGQFVGYALWFN